jgi:hypothetical protein
MSYSFEPMQFMNRVFLFICVLCCSINSFAQDEIDETKMVGFACFYEGRETKIVSQVSRLLKQKKYSRIRGMLNSNNTAEEYLAVICLERLSAKGDVAISVEEKSLIEQIRKSSKPVAVCSGCFPNPGIALKDAFDSDILWGATQWLDKHLKP